MPSSLGRLQAADIFKKSPIIPVVVIECLSDALPLAHALHAGGIRIMEITLRTPAALPAIHQLHDALPDLMIGAGTILTSVQYMQCVEAGAAFAISPGMSDELLETAQQNGLPLIPGASSASDLMKGMDRGYTHFKFFPAEASGGINWLKAIHGPFPDVRFCPTGGIDAKNFLDYLVLPHVECVGGSWIVPIAAIKQQDWNKITALSIAAIKQIEHMRQGVLQKFPL